MFILISVIGCQLSGVIEFETKKSALPFREERLQFR